MKKSFWLLNNYLTVVADRTTTDGRYDLIEGYFPAGAQTPPHRHTRYSEELYVLEGEFTVWIDKNKVVLCAGEIALNQVIPTVSCGAIGDDGEVVIKKPK